jgi:thiol-disulfide isomerase/thioredoxin
MLRVSLSVLLAIAACKSRTETGGRPQARPIDPPAAPGALAPNLRESREGVLATWLEPAAGEGHRLRFSRWANRAWSAPVTIAESARIVANWADVPSAARGGDGALVAHWAEVAGGGEAHTYDAIVARSTDGGATWKRLGALNDDGTATEHGFVSLLGEAGGVRAFWLDGRATAAAGGAMTLRTATVAEGVAPSELVDDRVCDCCGTAATATANGALVAYRDRGGDETRDIAVARGGTVGWSQPSAVHRDGWQINGCPVNGPALAAREGRVAIAWYTYAESTHRVRAAFSDDSGASFGAPIEVDAPRGSRAPLGRVSVALADDGSAVVGYLASDREDAEVLLRRVGRDGTLGPELRVGAQLAGRDAGFPRLARSGDSLVVMWTEPGSTSRIRAAEVPLAALPLAALPLAGPRLAERQEPTAPNLAVGTPALPLQAVNLEGAPATLAALRGRVVLVNLWAIWCEPCRQELPVLADLNEQDAARGLSVVAINVDRKRTRKEIADYVERRKLPFAVWLDPDDRAALAFGASTFPFNVLIDREGRVAWSRAGAVRAEDPELRAALEAALR